MCPCEVLAYAIALITLGKLGVQPNRPNKCKLTDEELSSATGCK